jgi:signal peptidase I
LTLVIFLVIQNFVAQPYQVQQMSMENTLQGGNTPFIKRVIGLAGDTVAVRDGQVVVNGKPLVERYVFPGTPPVQPTDSPPDRTQWTIAADELFVLGDHRGASSDSRVFGPIKRDSVIGRAWLRYWPFNVFGILPTPTYPELQARAP